MPIAVTMANMTVATSRDTDGYGSEYSQVPPASQASPVRQAPS
jgi:hypothetical protein